MIILKKFQKKAIEELKKAILDTKQNIIFESGTGSGKTIILTNFINDYMKENSGVVSIWFSPGKGNLEEQSKNKMDKYVEGSNTKNLQEVINHGFAEGDTVFINWELVNKKGNKALAESEKRNLEDAINIAHKSGLNFIVVIDEEHLNKTIKSYDVVDMFKPEKIIRASATPKKSKDAIHIKINEREVIEEGLIKKLLVINEDIDKESSIEIKNQVDYLLQLALKKQEELSDEYIKIGSKVNPLIVVQMPNKSDDLLNDIERFLNKENINYLNGKLAIWLSNRKENLDNIEGIESKVKVVIIKQAVATGWDCPRAQILVKLRDGMSETFEIQTIGRIRRMPEARHYDNLKLDNCYLYTLDEKFTEGVREHLGDNALDGTRLFLKKQFREFSLKKEKISVLDYEISPQGLLNSFLKFLNLEYGVINKKFNKNIENLKKYGYKFDSKIEYLVVTGTLDEIHKKNMDNLRKANISINVNTNEHGRILHQTINNIASSINISYDSMAIIFRRLFRKNIVSKFKVLDLDTSMFYAFIINNREILKKDLLKTISDEKYNGIQMAFNNQNLEEDFFIPKECIFTYNKEIKSVDVYDKNVYDGYLSSAEPRSQGEKVFESFCQENSNVKWFYKNGDKGNEYFSIVYRDNSTKKHHFYPDYILNFFGETWIIEVKGGMSHDGKSEDIDIYSDKKMNALIKYGKKHDIKCGFVRFNKADMKLYISCDKYEEDMNNDCWIRLDKYIKNR
ncbi:DEAD/DEAH box helicase [uncultured Clostridium sp.]|uniref:DEAD/DEAH box helicase n=1 Tax=Clostridium perfringens TaxID=1502 RepID=UPI00259238C3|nr:DEAD/DEAH box helicase family protein [uncultured Clostridium sp.]